MQHLAWGFCACALLVSSAWAAEVEATFTLPPDFAETEVTWSATPLDLPDEADVLDAMVLEREARAGPWVVLLEPGRYQVTAFSASDVFELAVTLGEGAAEHVVPVLQLAPSVPYRCTADLGCVFADPPTGLAFRLPTGWAAEAPVLDDAGGISAVFFEDIDGEGADVWFLNPQDWSEDEFGPCRPVDLGALCTFDVSPEAEAAFAEIAPSLRRTGPP